MGLRALVFIKREKRPKLFKSGDILSNILSRIKFFTLWEMLRTQNKQRSFLVGSRG